MCCGSFSAIVLRLGSAGIGPQEGVDLCPLRPEAKGDGDMLHRCSQRGYEEIGIACVLTANINDQVRVGRRKSQDVAALRHLWPTHDRPPPPPSPS